MSDRNIWDDIPSRGVFLALALRVGTVGLVIALLLALYASRGAMLLFFGGCIVAAILLFVSSPMRRLGVPHTIAVLVAFVLLTALLTGAAMVVGPALAPQFAELLQVAEEGLRMLEEMTGGGEEDGLGPIMTSVAGTLGRWSGALVGATTAVVLVVLSGVFLAVAPQVYRDGAVKLFPPMLQPRIAEALDIAGEGLSVWLRAQIFAMLIIGTGVSIGTWAIGLPAPLALGLIAGLLEFLPVVGPVAAAVPGVLIALTVGPATFVWTALLYGGLQQIEANVIVPLIAREVADVPPAVFLVVLVAFGAVLGPAGVILAAPLTVVLYLWIRRFWIEPINDER